MTPNQQAFSTLPRTEASPCGFLPEMRMIKGEDGYDINYRLWRGNENAPAALYIHGIEGHSQWFENTASLLNAKGISVFAPDRRGSGLNSSQRGHLPSLKKLVRDIEIMLEQMEREFPASKKILIGSCWGAKASAHIARKDYRLPGKVRLSGLVLVCPAIETIVDFDIATKCNIAVNHFTGRGSQRLYDIPLTADMFTDDSLYLDYIERDPLRLTRATADFFVESFKLSFLARRASGMIELPLMILQSGKDRIVDAEAIKRWFDGVPATDKTFKLFPDAAHSLDFDRLVFDEYASTLAEWILFRGRI